MKHEFVNLSWGNNQMGVTFKLCEKLISIGKENIVKDNMKLYLDNKRLTAEEYETLINLMNPNK